MDEIVGDMTGQPVLASASSESADEIAKISGRPLSQPPADRGGG